MAKHPTIGKALSEALAAWARGEKSESELLPLVGGNAGRLEKILASAKGRAIVDEARAAHGLPANKALQKQARIERGLPKEDRHP